MKHIILFAALSLLILPLQALAADDFGDRFSSDAPSALADQDFDTIEFDPSAIEPAAGDEAFDMFSAENANQETVGRTPEELISDIEKLISEIESKTDAP